MKKYKGKDFVDEIPDLENEYKTEPATINFAPLPIDYEIERNYSKQWLDQSPTIYQADRIEIDVNQLNLGKEERRKLEAERMKEDYVRDKENKYDLENRYQKNFGNIYRNMGDMVEKNKKKKEEVRRRKEREMKRRMKRGNN